MVGTGTAGAGTYYSKIGPAQVMAHGYLPCGNIQYHFGNEERIEARCTIASCKIGYFVLKGDQPANAAGEHHTNTVRVDIIFIQPGIGHGLVACYQCQLREAVNLSRFFFVQKISGFKILYFTGKSGTELRSIKQCNHVGSRNAINQSVPIIVY